MGKEATDQAPKVPCLVMKERKYCLQAETTFSFFYQSLLSTSISHATFFGKFIKGDYAKRIYRFGLLKIQKFKNLKNLPKTCMTTEVD